LQAANANKKAAAFKRRWEWALGACEALDGVVLQGGRRLKNPLRKGEGGVFWNYQVLA